ncbi:hypothetical protein Tco_1178498 [Tanacetum coccineum]
MAMGFRGEAQSTEVCRGTNVTDMKPEWRLLLAISKELLFGLGFFDPPTKGLPVISETTVNHGHIPDHIPPSFPITRVAASNIVRIIGGHFTGGNPLKLGQCEMHSQSTPHPQCFSARIIGSPLRAATNSPHYYFQIRQPPSPPPAAPPTP